MMSHIFYCRPVMSRRWAMLSSAVLMGLIFVALLIWRGQANAVPCAAPAGALVPPALPALASALLTPTTQTVSDTCPLDLVVVFDRSNSMGYDPVCYGCWARDPGLTEVDIPDYYEYPSNGDFYPITSTVLAEEVCFIDPTTGGLSPNGGYPPASFPYNSRRYIIIEAELYSRNNSQPETELRAQGKGYWALQRDGLGSYGFDGRGGYMAHHPERTFYPGTNPYGRFYTLTDAQSGNAPLLEYRFWINLNDTTPTHWGAQAYVWVRARRGPNTATDLYGNLNRGTLYWSLDDTNTAGFDFPTQELPSAAYNDLENNDGWRWIRLAQFDISAGQPPHNLSGPYVLQLWVGSSGIRLDRIIITNDSNTSLPSDARDHEATPGSAYGEACDLCNPIYALTVQESQCLGFSPVVSGTTDLRLHPLWGDWEQPLRGAKEATKRFVRRLDPQFDQMGFVSYSNSSTQDSQLECVSRLGAACYEGATPVSYTGVLAAIESVESDSTTCTACGMRDGLKVLGINVDNEGNFDNNCDGDANSHCGRGGVKKVMIVTTDGVPNASPGGVCDDEDYYPGQGSAYDCMVYYARQARQNGVTIFTIGLGFGVDVNILRAVAEEANGQYYHSTSAEDFDLIYDEIISSTISSCSPPNLMLTKSATPTEGLQAGDVITYSLSFSNTGDLLATNVVLTDRLPINTQFSSATGSFTPSAPVPGDVITWNLDRLTGGATGTQQLAVVIYPAQPGGVITNVAGIYGDQTEAQARLVVSFAPPAEVWSVYLPIILKVTQVSAQ